MIINLVRHCSAYWENIYDSTVINIYELDSRGNKYVTV